MVKASLAIFLLSCFTVSSAAYTCVPNNSTSNCTCELVEVPDPPYYWTWVDFVKLGASLILLALSALFSGLNLGLMGYDTTELDIVSSSGSEKEKKYARIIKPVRKRGNLLLCTLLVGNVMVNTGISILTADITSGVIGFVVSTVLITLFGEIIPQAICSRHALVVGAYTTWLVYIAMIILFPVTFPLAFVLDKILGKEVGTIYSNEELKKLVEIHAGHVKAELKQDEAKILRGVLEYPKKTVAEIMTPVKDAFMLDIDTKLDVDTVTKIWQTGRSRIPIYHKNKDNIVGMLFTKDLVVINQDDELPLSTILAFYGREVIKVFPDTHLDEMMKIFKSGRGHLAIVHNVVEPESGDPYYATVGLVTLEDVIEEILREEIVDESDIYVDNQNTKKVAREQRYPLNMFAKRSKAHRLTPKQVIAVGSYLSKSVDAFRLLPETILHKLLGTASLLTMDVDPTKEIFLYKKNQECDFFILVLNGKLEVISGKEQFVSELGPWSSVGSLALTSTPYVPDFDCKLSKSSQLVKIYREDYIKAVQKVAQDDKNFKLPKDMEWILKKKKEQESKPRSPSIAEKVDNVQHNKSGETKSTTSKTEVPLQFNEDPNVRSSQDSVSVDIELMEISSLVKKQ